MRRLRAIAAAESCLLAFALIAFLNCANAQTARSSGADNRATDESSTVARDDGDGALVQELFISETVTTQSKHEIQGTYGTSLRPWNGGALASSLMKAEYGITNRLQAEAEGSYQHARNVDAGAQPGFEDVSAGVRYALLRDSSVLALTLGLECSALNAESRSQLRPLLVAARRVGPVQFQLGAAITVTGQHEYEYTAASIYALRKWRPTLEFQENISAGEHRRLIAPGLLRKIMGFEIGAGVAIRISGAAPSYAPTLLITREFNGREN